MRFATGITLILLMAVAAAWAQPPRLGSRAGDGNAADFIARLMVYDANRDGQLARDELTDKRLQPLFQRADANGDSLVTPVELQALYFRESAALGAGRGGPPAPNRGFGGRPGSENGGRNGGPGLRGGPPRPGEVLPALVQERLDLTDEQRQQVAAMQKDVDARLARILTSEQRQRLDAMRAAGPGGPRGAEPE